MIIIVIIGLIASMVAPTWVRIRQRAQNARFVSDLRSHARAFEMYSLENGAYPADSMPGEFPVEMDGYLPRLNFTSPTSVGGLWDWDFNQFGYWAGLSVWDGDGRIVRAQLREADRMIDDGSLGSGNFLERTDGFIYIIQP